jgi:hypothetical protein
MLYRFFLFSILEGHPWSVSLKNKKSQRSFSVMCEECILPVKLKAKTPLISVSLFVKPPLVPVLVLNVK